MAVLQTKTGCLLHVKNTPHDHIPCIYTMFTNENFSMTKLTYINTTAILTEDDSIHVSAYESKF